MFLKDHIVTIFQGIFGKNILILILLILTASASASASTITSAIANNSNSTIITFLFMPCFLYASYFVIYPLSSSFFTV